MINYKEINQALLANKDINTNIEKDEVFYRYLLNNNIAYYYAKFLSSEVTEYEKKIIHKGDQLNDKYNLTLNYLIERCKSNGIDFILYKTYKFIPEVVDGDIDIVISDLEFDRFMKMLSLEGFICVEDEPGKGKCEKQGYCVIEPHVGVSWRSKAYISYDSLLKNVIVVDGRYKVLTPEFESLVKLMKVFYEPSYLTLYDILHIKKFLSNEVLSNYFLEKLLFSLDFDNISKAPLFLSFFDYFREWIRVFWVNKDLKLFVLHSIYFLYWKIRYKVSNKLPFSHDWNIEK